MSGRTRLRRGRLLPLLVAGALSLQAGCTDEEEGGGKSCDKISGTPWTPSVVGASSTNHDAAVTLTKQTLTGTAELVGLGQGLDCSAITSTCPDTRSRLESVSFAVGDVGANGSISLTAQAVNFDSELSGDAYPVLVSLVDPNGKEYVNLPIDPAEDCAEEGLFVCSGGSCSANSGCAPAAPSAFQNWTHWRQGNIPAYGSASQNTFPNCSWAAGSPTCHFASGGNFFDGGKIPQGTYVAKYALVTTHYSKVSEYYTGYRVTVVQKADTTAATLPPTAGTNGAVDINVILVGETNIKASRTAKGGANLNALLQHVHSHYSSGTTGAGIKIGTVSAYEWGCDEDVSTDGEDYAVVDFSDVGDMFYDGSKLVASASAGKAVNVFLVSAISHPTLGNAILGVAGAIGGPLVHGTGSSGVVFKSFNKIDTFNADCDPGGAACDSSDQEADFVDWGATVSHEIGHYLGLNHPQERSGAATDPIPDTPTCGTDTISGEPTVTINSCENAADCAGSSCVRNGVTTFCHDVVECQFNHVMWYTTKAYNEATDAGDGNLFSPQAATVLNYSPFIQ
ncbi:MAG: hypothetical protein IT285_01950 [Bdellovibrionales bacterium]|nr:hypothetical protein [Bdellovibrionales bacterium]